MQPQCVGTFTQTGWSSTSGSDLTKVTIIYNLSALSSALCVCTLVQCPGELDFNGIFIQVITQGQGHVLFVSTFSEHSVSSFPEQWHQGMMLPVLGLWLHHLGFCDQCILLSITDFLQNPGILIARSKLQWTHWMKSLPWYLRTVLWISSAIKVF